MEPKHGGCAVCRSREEEILTSGTAAPGCALKGASSFAVCSKAECRAQVLILEGPK